MFSRAGRFGGYENVARGQRNGDAREEDFGATRFSIARRKASTSRSAQDPSTACPANSRGGFARSPGSLFQMDPQVIWQ